MVLVAVNTADKNSEIVILMDGALTKSAVCTYKE
jgi:hypothetical protein